MITKTEFTPAEVQRLIDLILDLHALCEVDDDLATEIEDDVVVAGEILGIFPGESDEE